MIFGGPLTRRHILREHPALDTLSRFAEQQSWDLISETPADPERGVEYGRMWATPTSVTFHYGEDSVLPASYVFFAGDKPEAAAQFERVMSNELQPWTLDELLDAVRNAPGGPDRARALLRAGLGASLEFDQRFATLIIDGMTDEDAQIRKVGVLACSYSPWAQYRPVLEQIATDDADVEARELAQATLRAFDQHGVGEP